MKKPRHSGRRLIAALAILVTAGFLAWQSHRLAGRPALTPEVATAATRDTSRREDGRHLLEEFTRPDSALGMTELGSAHPAVIFDDTGDPSDWLEITNVTQGAVDLAGWRLGFGPRMSTIWALPELTLPAGESLILWLSGKARMSSTLARACAVELDEDHVGTLHITAPAGTRLEFHQRPPPPRAVGVEIDVPEALEAQLWLKLRTRHKGRTVLDVSVDGQPSPGVIVRGSGTHVVRVPPVAGSTGWSLEAGKHEVQVHCDAGAAELRYVSFLEAAHGHGPTHLHAHLPETVSPGDILQLLSPRNEIMERVKVPVPSPGLTWQKSEREWEGRRFATPSPAGATFGELPLLEEMPFSSAEPLVVRTGPTAEGMTLRFTLDGRVPTAEDPVLVSSQLTLHQPGLLRVRGFLGKQPATAVLTRHFWIGDLPHLPVVMVGLDRDQLLGDNLGAYTNSALRSPEWERVADTRMFLGEEVWMEGPVGFRMHAGTGIPQGNWSPFRLYSRARLGPERMGVHPFDENTAPPTEILVDPTYGWLRDHLAYSMINAVGALAPRTRPVLVYFNGNFHGIGTLVERINDDFLTERLGHTDFDLLKGKPWEVKKGSTKRFDALTSKVSNVRHRSMAELQDQVDFESLTLLHLTYLLAGTVDEPSRAGESWQGYMAMDRSVDPGRLHFLAWDLDGSFQSPDLNPLPVLDDAMLSRSWRQRFLGVRLVHELLKSDPDYRSYYLRLVESTWNFALASEHWRPIVDRLESDARQWSRHPRPLYKPDPGQRPVSEDGSWARQFRTIRRSLDHRPAMMFQALAEYLDLAPPHRVTVQAPASQNLTINGHQVQGPWQGTWFTGGTVRLSVPAAARESFRGYRVNGRDVHTPEVDLLVQEDLQIEVLITDP